MFASVIAAGEYHGRRVRITFLFLFRSSYARFFPLFLCDAYVHFLIINSHQRVCIIYLNINNALNKPKRSEKRSLNERGTTTKVCAVVYVRPNYTYFFIYYLVFYTVNENFDIKKKKKMKKTLGTTVSVYICHKQTAIYSRHDNGVWKLILLMLVQVLSWLGFHLCVYPLARNWLDDTACVTHTGTIGAAGAFCFCFFVFLYMRGPYGPIKKTRIYYYYYYYIISHSGCIILSYTLDILDVFVRQEYTLVV